MVPGQHRSVSTRQNGKWDPSRGIVFAPKPSSTSAASQARDRVGGGIDAAIGKLGQLLATKLRLDNSRAGRRDDVVKPGPSLRKASPAAAGGHAPPASDPDVAGTITTRTATQIVEVATIRETSFVTPGGPVDPEANGGTGAGPAAAILNSTTITSASASAVSTSEASDELPPGSLLFSIPQAVRQGLESSSPIAASIYWHYDLYRGPKEERVTVHYCQDLEQAERVAKLFADKSVIGFDLEWKPQALAADSIKDNVSLIQLASEEQVALFHVALFPEGDELKDLVAPTLKAVMESPEITKLGVAIKADCTRLRNYLGIQSQGTFELSHLHKLVKYYANDGATKVDKRLVSLAEQVEEHLQMPLWKGDVRSSNWTQKLDSEQIKYAASDAYGALHVYDMLERKRNRLKPTPPRPAHAELNLPIRLAEKAVVAPAQDTVESADAEAAMKTDDDSGNTPDEDQIAQAQVVAQGVGKVATTDNQTITAQSVSVSAASISAVTGAVATSAATARPAKHPQVVLADTWVCEYRSGTKKPPTAARAMPSQLRAYALWHRHEHTVEDIARLLRDPPLQTMTVASYILEAIRLEHLGYDSERIRTVVARMPDYVMNKAWYRHLGQSLA